MKVISTADGIKLTGLTHFDLEQTFCCGQCFRFDRFDGGFKGIAYGKIIECRNIDDGVLLKGVSKSDFDNIWYDYFDFGTDYQAIIDSFPTDAHLSTATSACGGIHILNQEPWEALCSFVVSQNNNIPRIKKIISTMCASFGEQIGDGSYAFPTAKTLAGLKESDLDLLHCGYRAPYIIEAAKRYADGSINPDTIRAMSYQDAKKALLSVKGIGPKVADCALLFGFGFRQAFPIDTWVKKVMRERYGDRFDPSYFGAYAGVAQQYLFYYERGTRE